MIACRRALPNLERLRALPEALGRIATLLADTGYLCRENVERCEAAGIEPPIPAARQSRNPTLVERFGTDPPTPSDLKPAEAMARRLRTWDGKARDATVETSSASSNACRGFANSRCVACARCGASGHRCVSDGI